MTDHAEQVAALAARFEALYQQAPRLFRAPGRVNLIGEHTDYNDGFVMPAAIDRSCFVAAASRSDGRLVCRSEDLNDAFDIDITAPQEPSGTWRDYIVGVAALLQARGIPVSASLLIHSEVPAGAGLSSSAALETSVATALLGLAGATMQATEIAQLCQRAEHEYPGVQCGIMDQYIAVHARQGTALVLDCRTLTHEYVQLPHAVRLVVCDSMARHALADGEYNRRRLDCREAVEIIGRRWSGIEALRDVTPAMLEDSRTKLGDRLYRRARHVLTENARVQAMATALAHEDLAAVKPLMWASHQSLRTDYEVSCAELDALVEIAMQQPGIYGARMTGGGFGGCTVNLVDEKAVASFTDETARAYERRLGVRPEIYVTTAAAAAGPA